MGAQGLGEISIPSPQFPHDPETALPNKSLFVKKGKKVEIRNVAHPTHSRVVKTRREMGQSVVKQIQVKVRFLQDLPRAKHLRGRKVRGERAVCYGGGMWEAKLEGKEKESDSRVGEKGHYLSTESWRHGGPGAKPFTQNTAFNPRNSFVLWPLL